MSPSHRHSRASTLAFFALICGLLATSPAAATEQIKLDSSDARNESIRDPAAVSSPLAQGQAYVVTVTGTSSIWPANAYAGHTCGAAESAPMEASPGHGPTLAGWDAEIVWAGPVGGSVFKQGLACQTLPLPARVADGGAGFQFANGDGPWGRPTPVGGARSVPRADHTYSYQLVGLGLPLKFRFADLPATDNSGVFTITIDTQAECDASACLRSAGVLFDQVATPQVPAASSAIPVAKQRSCSTAKVLSIRLTQPGGVSFARTAYFLNGKRERVVRGRRIFIGTTRRVRVQKFRGVPAGPLTLRVDVITTTGQRITVKRAIDRCQKRKTAQAVPVRRSGG